MPKPPRPGWSRLLDNPRAFLFFFGFSILALLLFRTPAGDLDGLDDDLELDLAEAEDGSTEGTGLYPRPVHHDEDTGNFSSALPGSGVIVHQEALDGNWNALANAPVKLQDLPADLVDFPPRTPPGAARRYFCYQPSGGWGNQRYILRWAMIVANAMQRTLVVAPLAPHSDIWHGFNEFNKSQLVNAALVLDIKALQHAMDQGVVFLDDLPVNAVQAAREAGLSVKSYVKPHFKYVGGNRRDFHLREKDIREDWLKVTEDVVFWEKGSMWLCCYADYGPDGVWYGRHIMFNSRLKAVARQLTAPLNIYNAVHVRRGDHSSTDRRTAERYYKVHSMSDFDKKLPLYVATDETYYGWFRYFRKRGRFRRLVFWKDLDREVITKLLQDFPVAMHGDVLGFVEQLICGNAVQWEGSHKSTFSAGISTIRLVPALRELAWSYPLKPSMRKAGGGAGSAEDQGEVDEGEVDPSES